MLFEVLTPIGFTVRTSPEYSPKLGDGVVLMKDAATGQPIGLELLAYRPGDDQFDAVSVEVGRGDRQPVSR